MAIADKTDQRAASICAKLDAFSVEQLLRASSDYSAEGV